ncbi:hypothetical protein NHX12_022117 [Muraenolepis orangiensis]|uniref:Immunoglobulin domain-containing protein n=1 Tax=Muraenolepis orangiensis TaxID=630683 RepID=A0A9Q0EQZ2_9TELE|nr:hypothetical protein NHX12_022117 [Muraenolepis orangiensis]
MVIVVEIVVVEEEEMEMVVGVGMEVEMVVVEMEEEMVVEVEVEMVVVEMEMVVVEMEEMEMVVVEMEEMEMVVVEMEEMEMVVVEMEMVEMVVVEMEEMEMVVVEMEMVEMVVVEMEMMEMLWVKPMGALPWRYREASQGGQPAVQAEGGVFSPEGPSETPRGGRGWVQSWKQHTSLPPSTHPPLQGPRSWGAVVSDRGPPLLFTVTITSQQEGEQHYWCAVEINNGADQGQYFQLLVSKGVSSLRVDQQYITGSEGDGVEISCHYAKKLKDKIGWCKLGDCEGQRGGVKGGLGASINTSRPGVAVVTMTSLRMDSSGCESFDLKHLLIPGPSEMEDDVVYSSVVCSLVKGPSEMEGDVVYSSVVHHLPEDLLFTVTITSQQEGEQHYWCAVEINNGVDQRQYFQLLVSEGVSSLRVDQQYITGSEGDGVEISCHYAKKLKDKIGWCKLGDCEGQRGGVKGGLGASINTSRPGVAVVTMSNLRMDSSGWYLCYQGKLNIPVHLTVAERTTTLATTMNPLT